MQDVREVRKGDRFDGGQGGAKFAFRGVDRVVEALSASMRKHRLVMLPTAHSAPDFLPVQTSGGKQSNMVRVLVTYTLYGPAGDFLEIVVPGEAMDNGDKAVSKAMSVAWRTALLQGFFLPTNDPDPDSESYEMEKPGRQAPLVQSGRPATTRAEAAVQRTEKRDQALADWNAAIEGAQGDYDALGQLYLQAKQQKAPAEIIQKIWNLGQAGKQK
jgi:hypothetical protein